MKIYKITQTQNKVIAMITGPTGAGKTTLLNQIKNEIPEVTIKDIDDFVSSTSSYVSPSTQSQINSFISANNNIVFAGMLFDVNTNWKRITVSIGNENLIIPAKYKFMLNVDVEENMKRKMQRTMQEYQTDPASFKEGKPVYQDFVNEQRLNQEYVQKARQIGYMETSAPQIIATIKEEINNPKY